MVGKLIYQWCICMALLMEEQNFSGKRITLPFIDFSSNHVSLFFQQVMDIVLGYTEKLVLKNYQSFEARSGCFTDPYRRDACLLLSILVLSILGGEQTGSTMSPPEKLLKTETVPAVKMPDLIDTGGPEYYYGTEDSINKAQ
ncbi:uncharacterized protein LOC117922453 [Vitis riparia]|uniref:uncharacterized protein LOC117922453 n=1 Tax=Vitis riparia TaxID=96939 RepID=UPI00155ADE2D|nr:uncharacterized protein LOC117922453 [Vitis riparia]